MSTLRSEEKRFHVVRITTRKSHLIGSYADRAQARQAVISAHWRLTYILRDGITGQRFTPYELAQEAA